MLKTVIDTTDGLDEAIIPLYAEKDGKFILQVEGVDAHPDVANLKSAYERVKTDRDTVKAERDELKANAPKLPEGFTLEKWEKLKDGKADEAALVSLRQEMEGTIADLTGRLEEANGKALKNALDRDLTDALTAEGVTDPMYIEAARSLLAPDVKVDESGKPFVETDMGPQALAEHVQRFAAGRGKVFVTPPTGGGGKGGEGGGSKGENPWKAETRNLTRQAEIMKNDPAEATRLKADAGVQ